MINVGLIVEGHCVEREGDNRGEGLLNEGFIEWGIIKTGIIHSGRATSGGIIEDVLWREG
jgi:hypothetical protein